MRWVVWLLLFPVTLLAEPKVKQAIGTVLKSKGQIQTGSSSRIELELPFMAIVRIGSNAAVEFSPDNRTLTMDSGTMLVSSPKDTGSMTINAAGVTAAVANGDLQMSNVFGQVKLISLNGRIRAGLGDSKKSLRSGQMINVPAGATTLPPVTAIRLSTMLKTSVLFNMGPLPSSRAIRQNATKQAPPGIPIFVTGGFDPDWGGGGNLFSSIGPAGTAAMIARMESNVPAPPVLAPNVIPTRAQIVQFEEAGVAVPRSNERALQQNQGRPATVPNQTPRPQMTPQPQPTRPPFVRPDRPDRPNQDLPGRSPIFRPPIAPP